MIVAQIRSVYPAIHENVNQVSALGAVKPIVALAASDIPASPASASATPAATVVDRESRRVVPMHRTLGEARAMDQWVPERVIVVGPNAAA